MILWGFMVVLGLYLTDVSVVLMRVAMMRRMLLQTGDEALKACHQLCLRGWSFSCYYQSLRTKHAHICTAWACCVLSYKSFRMRMYMTTFHLRIPSLKTIEKTHLPVMNNLHLSLLTKII